LFFVIIKLSSSNDNSSNEFTAFRLLARLNDRKYQPSFECLNVPTALFCMFLDGESLKPGIFHTSHLPASWIGLSFHMGFWSPLFAVDNIPIIGIFKQ